jgi:shikimate kinase
MKSLTNFFLIGAMGAGKTTIGRYLAHTLEWDFYDSDKEIERSTGVSVAWIFDVEGEAGFRKREEAIIDELSQRPRSILATGGGAILSPLTQERLSHRGTIIYLQVSVQEQQERVLRNQNRPLLQTPNICETLMKLQSERAGIYEKLADWTFSTDNYSALEISQAILTHIEKNPS